LSKPPCPAEFLVQQAHYADSLDKLVDEFVPQLEQQGQTEQAERVKRFADLYRSGSASPGPGWARSSQNTQRLPSFNPQPATTRTTTPSSHDPNRIQQRQALSREERGRRARDRRRANP
jgi:hypothetical protein